MSPKFCVFCGNPLKSTDKFCITCGKPIITNLPSKKKAKTKETIIREENKKEQKELGEVEQSEDDQNEIILDEEKKEKPKKESKKEKEKQELKPLPDEVKEQMVLYIEYNDLQINKKVLKEKLNEISKSMKDDRYEYDFDFKKEINIKLEAVKTLISELKQKENEIKQNLEEPFIVQRINRDIETKTFQLENLSREHKFHKVDKETFETLREKYKEEKLVLENERKDLVSGMKLWIQDLKLEKAELSVERKLNKGRYRAKEISEDIFKGIEKDFDLRSKKIDSKINTLEKLTK